MSLEDYRGVIIERVLERGSWKQVRWLFATYGEAEVADLCHQAFIGDFYLAGGTALALRQANER